MANRQSYRGYVRQHLLRIEEMIAFGHSHEAIRTKLREEGFEGTISSFRDALMHARKWRRNLEKEKAAISEKVSSPEVAKQATRKNQNEQTANVKDKKTDQTNDVDQFFKRKSLFRKNKP